MRGLNGKGLVAAIEAELLAEGCLIEVDAEVTAEQESSRGLAGAALSTSVPTGAR